jgi:pimeloyl-ACP methyl ester carboxylesterase
MTTNPVLVDFLAFVQTLTDPIDRAFVEDFQASTAFNPLPPDFLNTVVDESLKVPARVWQDALAGLVAENTLPELWRIEAPTLLVWGDRDDIFPFSDQTDLLGGIPDVTFLVYEDIGHGLHWEVPERFTADLAAFLQRN